MKKVKRIFVLAVISILTACQQPADKNAAQSEAAAPVSITGPEALAKAVRYHDPEGKWSTFQGKVRMVTAFADGSNRGEEIIELRRADHYYKCIRNLGDFHSEKGVENGACFVRINGNDKPGEEEIKKQNLSCEATKDFQYHHSAHIGWVMEAQSAGLYITDSTVLEDFKGKKCLAVTMEGKKGAVVHPYWEGRITLYLDPETFAFSGTRWTPANPEYFSLYSIPIGEITVNSIRIPQIKSNYKVKDGSLYFTDVFTYAEENK